MKVKKVRGADGKTSYTVGSNENGNYLRAEADSLALEFRLHSKEIHENFINNDERVFNALLPIRDGLMVCYKK